MSLDMAVLIMVKDRPHYLERALTSLALAKGANELLSGVTVALGKSTEELVIKKVIRDIVPGARVWHDSDRANASNGVGRAMGEAASRIFSMLKPDFLIITEEDILLSDDVLRYFHWAATEFRDSPQVLAVLAHNVGCAGWDKHEPPQDADAEQETVRLLPYYNPWTWGVWADRWEKILEPQWDWECSSGFQGYDSGQDWNIAVRIIPQGGYLCVVPDASRSQNLGRFGGWASTEETWAFSQSQSFREKRGKVDYRLVESSA